MTLGNIPSDAIADLESGAECILRHLDSVRFKPFLVLRLRLGQRGRLGQARRLAFWRGHLDCARHSLGSAIRWQVLPNSRASVGKTDRACSPSFNPTYCVRGGAPSSSLSASPPR